jgi:pre-mRNA-splicing factor ISY1
MRADRIAKSEKATRVDLLKRVDADYYGYRDEEDGVLVALERDAEARGEICDMVAMAWSDQKLKTEWLEHFGTRDPHAGLLNPPRVSEEAVCVAPVYVHVSVPSPHAIEHALVERRKRVSIVW